MKYAGWLVVLTGMLLCSNVWAAAFNPDTDPNFLFNLNFEDNTDAFTTIDAKASKTGTIVDYNTLYDPTMWTTGGIRNICGDFKKTDDFDCNRLGGDGNDQSVHVVAGPETSLFEWGIDPNKDKRTWAFWFNMPDANGLSQGTIIRYENFYRDDPEATTYLNYWWEIHVNNSRLEVSHKLGCLTMTAVPSLTTLGIAENTWHHAALTIDLTSREASKLYIDGLEIPVSVSKYAKRSGNVDPSVESPLWIGAGDRNFDGKLDEIRSYDRALTPTEVSILYQYNAYDPNRAVAIYPIPKSTGVRITTDVNWVPAPKAGLTKQKIYFSTATGSGMPVIKEVDASEVNSIAYNSELNGGVPLVLNQAYNWYIRSTIGGVYQRTPANASSYFTFTTETGEATDPVPPEFQEDIVIGQVDLQWTAPSAQSYDVYFSTDRSLVEFGDPNVRIANDITDTNIAISVTGFGETYYWQVRAYYGAPNSKEVSSPVWNFITMRYPIIFNTDDINDVNYGGHFVHALNCDVNDSNGWRTISTATIASDGVAVFDFTGGFSAGKRYGIVVYPALGTDLTISDVRTKTGHLYPDDVNMIPTPIDMNVNGDFYFDGKLDISGGDVSAVGGNPVFARCGGHRGMRNDRRTDGPSGWSNAVGARFLVKYDYRNRRGGQEANDIREYYDPNVTSDLYAVYGPGTGIIPPFKVGGGAGHGGIGGQSGRGTFHGIFAGGPPYGDKEVPVSFGGSAGGYGSTTCSGAGGGGIGILATGNVTIGSNAKIFANGGNVYALGQYAGGGGSGGSVRIIADGNVTIAGNVTVNGGQGGNGNEKSNNTGGGGAGGRIAIFYGGSYTKTGTISATGGAEGIATESSMPEHNGYTLAEAGKDGTIYIADSTVVSPKKASAPTPRDGNEMVYAPSASTSRTLSWYSGYKAADDRVWFGTDADNLAVVGDAGIPATRGQHGVTVSIDPDKTYYWKVMTDNNSISSDVWSFKTVGWQCQKPNVNSSGVGEPGWPEWDINYDCVVNDIDFWYFAKDWRVPGYYILDDINHNDVSPWTSPLTRLTLQWLECRGRSDNGCNGW